MKWLLGLIAVAVFLPAFAIAAIALGPVGLGILCAVGFGLIVFLLLEAFVELENLFKEASRRHRRHARMTALHG